MIDCYVEYVNSLYIIISILLINGRGSYILNTGI